MPKLRRLSGTDVVRILEGFGFSVHAHGGQPPEIATYWPVRSERDIDDTQSSGT